ncbi:hypothetical protein KOW79_010974 [Hemibagrus wyckioides]|uniref:Uncharacterized protein n=1 Tax=Hemibagrus wyckioides TaxID=337641 RepID=A0A9D3NPD0_9TELE|nr:uncharacterized protein LOC131362859 [Hemibagrus wyckioides]KAG7326049.1 hypothetical protein KOW79_010974 [Hemibagrus wyckioides]
MSQQEQILKDFLIPDLSKDKPEVYLRKIRDVASKHRQSKIKLKKMGKYSFKVGSLAETSYKNEPEMLEEWEQFYLPDHMYMEVIGVLEKFSCNSPNDELVLMVCEDGKVFAYEGNRLHLISDSLKDLFEHGLQFPGIKEYYRGQSFEDMTDKEWDKVKKSKEAMKMMKDHQEMLECAKDSYLTNLDIIMGRAQGGASSAGARDEPIPVHL